MSSQSIIPQRPQGGASIVQKIGTVRPATAEQAWAMFDLMFSDVIAQAETTMAGWAERCPLDDQDAPQAKARETAAKDRLSRMTQVYARRHGKLDVPLISLGSDYDTMRTALGPVLDRLKNSLTG
ncbi:conserved protein of unknown function [Acidithiobacillus ferrivorans]|uniref:Uncharacterized protein n=1 Tax=Acidithiobacillus ferrivorans TaxID=160808 RepID=A0A060UQJ4_9PROT|nr:hypothetical protein [Acidithiobacillus ferrivorans]CDQ10521.1 conserved hypothetical protein [Acidithiobacillus ferrivorans]SMH64550.1 conserved protein of unknown function [Acidithiobacillus ferrivorans]